jgi:hypothetical protein
VTKRESREEREVRVVPVTTLCSLSKFVDKPILPLSDTVFRPNFTNSWEMCLDIIFIWSVTVFRIKRILEKFNIDNTIQIVASF